jgi:hypothetical protein
MSLLWAILLLLVWSPSADASIAGGPKVLPRKGDVPYIKCEVCTHLARNAYDQAQQLLLKRRQGAKVSAGWSGCGDLHVRAPLGRLPRPPARPHLAAASAQVDEGAMIDLVERVTVAWKEEGEWMAHLHLQPASSGTLGMRDMRQLGECGEACKTIERAAEAVMGEHDTDVAEALFTVSGAQVCAAAVAGTCEHVDGTSPARRWGGRFTSGRNAGVCRRTS